MPTQRIALSQPIETRDGTLTKDSKTVNYVFETRDGKREVVKRPGLKFAKQVVANTPPAVVQARGMGHLQYGGLLSNTDALLMAIGTHIYYIEYTYPNPTSIGVVTDLGAISGASTGGVYFAQDQAGSHMTFHDSVSVYQFDGGISFSTTTTPLVSPLAPGIVVLDHYFFVASILQNRIYNSDLGNPTSWNASGYVSFDQTGDTLVAIAKHLNYVVAFGSSSVVFFYDAAIAAPNSPLAPNTSYNLEVGCAHGDSVASGENTVLWIGSGPSTGRSVYMLEGVSPIKVSTSNIDKILDADTMSKVNSYLYKFGGHTLYVLTLHDSKITIVYDINEKIWYQWTQYTMISTGDTGAGTYAETYFRPTFFSKFARSAYALDDDSGVLYQLDPNTYQDNGQSIYCRTVTDLSDNTTTKRKFYGRLEIVGDKQAGATMQIRHTGNDYNTWSSYRTVDLNATRSQIYLGGADRRRAWEFLVTSNTPLRLESAEIDFRLGEMDQEEGIGGGRYRR